MNFDGDYDEQRAILKAELEGVKTENLRLKEMLDQATNNYQALHLHFKTFIQTQMKAAAVDPIDEKAIGGGGGDGGGGGGNNKLVPRQFMDLGLATNMETDESSLSSSEGRSGGERSPGTTTGEVASVAAKRHSPDQGSNNWGSNKVSKFSSNSSGKELDQTEATMRKARVSVRAKSDTTMVII